MPYLSNASGGASNNSLDHFVEMLEDYWIREGGVVDGGIGGAGEDEKMQRQSGTVEEKEGGICLCVGHPSWEGGALNHETAVLAVIRVGGKLRARANGGVSEDVMSGKRIRLAGPFQSAGRMLVEAAALLYPRTLAALHLAMMTCRTASVLCSDPQPRARKGSGSSNKLQEPKARISPRYVHPEALYSIACYVRTPPTQPDPRPSAAEP
jgi:hypothetical protein